MRELFVLATPSITVSPRSLTVQEGQRVRIFCQATVPGKNNQEKLDFKWYRWNGKAHEDISRKEKEGK